MNFAFEYLSALFDGLDLSPNFVDFLVELLQSFFVVLLLLLGLFELEYFVLQLLLQRACLLHEDLFVLHVGNEYFMQTVKLLLVGFSCRLRELAVCLQFLQDRKGCCVLDVLDFVSHPSS